MIGKRVVDCLLVLIEPFSLDVTAEALRANIDWKLAFTLQQCEFGPKFQVERVASTNHSFCQINYDWSFMWYKNVGTSFFRFVWFVTMHAFDTDRQTDRRTDWQKGLRNTVCCTVNTQLGIRPPQCVNENAELLDCVVQSLENLRRARHVSVFSLINIGSWCCYTFLNTVNTHVSVQTYY